MDAKQKRNLAITVIFGVLLWFCPVIPEDVKPEAWHLFAIFAATIEATAEALWNSLFMAESMTGRDGYHVDALPVEKVLEMLRNR